MPAFPMFVSLESKRVLVIGAGALAEHKVRALVPFGADITIAAPEKPQDWAQNCHWIQSVYHRELLDGADFVICAIDDKEVSACVSKDCKESHIPVNVVDEKDKCTFLFGSMITQGPLSIGISTDGASPSAAHWLKEQISQMLPDHFDEVLSILARERQDILTAVEDQKERSRILKARFFELLEEKR